MYRSIRSALKKRNELFKNSYVSVAWRKSVKCYHSESGVYGYRPKKTTFFAVSQEKLNVRAKYSNFQRLVTAYREHAHKQANIDPISVLRPEAVLELDPQRYGLDLNDIVKFRGIINTSKSEGTVREAVDILNELYIREIGAEFSHLESLEEREWFAESFEKTSTEELDDGTKRAIATEMLKSQAFDNFLKIKFVSFKRYAGEGAEAMMAFVHEFFKLSANDGIEQIVLAMPHRGRLNFLTGMLQFPPEKLFRKLRGLPEFPDDVKATGDVASHFVSSVDLDVNRKKLHVTMLYNPSHLEAVNPVSMGKTRGIMQSVNDGDYAEDGKSRWSDKVLNLQIHGDAAYAGQGVNQESLALSAVPHFEIGGTVHLVVNNQLGFTTPARRGRSSRYCTDIAKSISAPVLHVNGDYPEMVVRATRIAFAYQRKFRKDVFIDMNCFRRWGHNELDDPTFTNPILYKLIQNRASVPDLYKAKLEDSGVLTKSTTEEIVSNHTNFLGNALKQVDNYIPQPSYFTHRWAGFQQAQSSLTSWDTGVDLGLLKYVASRSVKVQDDLDIHPQVMKSHVQGRLKKLESGEHLDWSTAETAAFGSLLYQGYNVRISGQDVGRGTFSQRHAMIVNQSTGEMFIPLNSMVEGQTGKIELANSILSEEAVLGYEYGISIASPMTLTIWEAQFGDFFNGAQIIIDTFVTSGETKWMTSSGLTMLLPHGWDGAGPDHTSGRVERFLQLTDSKENAPDGDDVNFQVVNPTTPAQYFHLLRRQMVRNFRKPLVVVAPKILLRHASATSSLGEMGPNTSFENVIADNFPDPSKVQKVILVSGKHFYALEKQRELQNANNVAIIRVESLCPFPLLDLNHELQKYPHAKTFIWSQEEPQNMGAWSFVKPRFENLCGRRLKYCGRESSPTPAVGVAQQHQREALEVVVKPFTMK
ncbi:probable 2-oxoglutarate dehydrogenase E1 component DHKTD1 homolog, mitochondrial [Diachasma alloeum]|uniref:probable 2-oxoglutarate dehydrogenase E1 component DHKTD1 homolog, mitochondrial n=1 Tax=Diachasma alloeum TaxID=454923 RepID=UPI0007382B27|nr:probable 2-oxoglutarate dehydrogenase E1 component DHKTD1 homolog, mitochondrial [Diachasma alloeum]